MGTEGLLSMTVDSVVEDVLNQHAVRLSLDRDLVFRREEEAASRRYEAASWLRRTVGVVAARDLPEEPSEEEFRLGLRNGIVLCNALNKLHPGTIPKVVEAPSDFTPPPDGAALCAYQYFENLRNFLVALEDLRLPTFEASDLEKGGKAARVVNSILALKSHSERRGKSHWRRSNSSFAASNNGHSTSTCSSSSSTKYFVRKNSEPFVNSIIRSQSSEALSVEQNLSLDVSIESSQMTASHSLHMLVSTMLSGKKPEEVPELVGSIISRVVEEFENRMSTQNEMVAKSMDDFKSYMQPNNIPSPASSKEAKIEKVRICKERDNNAEASEEKQVATNLNVDQQKRKILELRQVLCSVKSGMENMRRQYHDEFIKLGKHLGKLSHAASGYHKVLEENRKLYNIVQDLKGNIRVYCRVRPLKNGIPTSIASIEDDQITILTPSNYGKEGRKSFKFNKIFGPSATQEEVFSDMRPLIRSVLDGYNVCIFAYGQTGSGKTHTMTGPKDLTEESQGVNYRALNDLFYMTETSDALSFDISVQMIEIYNEQVRDLLVDNGGSNKKLEIRSSSQKGGLAVPGANIVPVDSALGVIELMNVGNRNRAVGFTAMNDRSSRSHSCLTVHVQGRDLTSGAVLRGSMHLVDLAGSERVDKSEAKGERLKEAQHINKSLSALGDVISSLAQKNSHVPYRNSKLTQLLQGSLGGQAKSLMFVHIRPESDAVGESLSTLKFAERVATVELGAARINKDNTEVKELKEQLASLKAQLAMKDVGESNRIRSPEIYRTKSCAVPTTQLSIRQPMEEVGNIEMRSNLPTIQRKLNLDPCETASETDSASWIDKTIIENSNDENINMNNCASLSSSANGSGLTLMSPIPNYYQRYASDASIAYQDIDCAAVTQSEPGGSDDYDELELGTSYCSSEHDMMMTSLTWNSDLPKISSLENGSSNIGTVSRLKKPQARLATSPETRSTSHAYKPSRKTKNASSLTPGKVGNVKRSVTGKVGNGK